MIFADLGCENRSTGDGRNFASNFWKTIGTIFSQVFGIICISGGHQDLLPSFYQVFTLISVGISRIQDSEGKTYQKPIRTNKVKIKDSYSNSFIFLFLAISTCKISSIYRIKVRVYGSTEMLRS